MTLFFRLSRSLVFKMRVRDTTLSKVRIACVQRLWLVCTVTTRMELDKSSKRAEDDVAAVDGRGSLEIANFSTCSYINILSEIPWKRCTRGRTQQELDESVSTSL